MPALLFVAGPALSARTYTVIIRTPGLVSHMLERSACQLELNTSRCRLPVPVGILSANVSLATVACTLAVLVVARASIFRGAAAS